MKETKQGADEKKKSVKWTASAENAVQTEQAISRISLPYFLLGNI